MSWLRGILCRKWRTDKHIFEDMCLFFGNRTAESYNFTVAKPFNETFTSLPSIDTLNFSNAIFDSPFKHPLIVGYRKYELTLPLMIFDKMNFQTFCPTQNWITINVFGTTRCLVFNVKLIHYFFFCKYGAMRNGNFLKKKHQTFYTLK